MTPVPISEIKSEFLTIFGVEIVSFSGNLSILIFLPRAEMISFEILKEFQNCRKSGICLACFFNISKELGPFPGLIEDH